MHISYYYDIIIAIMCAFLPGPPSTVETCQTAARQQRPKKAQCNTGRIKYAYYFAIYWRFSHSPSRVAVGAVCCSVCINDGNKRAWPRVQNKLISSSTRTRVPDCSSMLRNVGQRCATTHAHTHTHTQYAATLKHERQSF